MHIIVVWHNFWIFTRFWFVVVALGHAIRIISSVENELLLFKNVTSPLGQHLSAQILAMSSGKAWVFEKLRAKMRREIRILIVREDLPKRVLVKGSPANTLLYEFFKEQLKKDEDCTKISNLHLHPSVLEKKFLPETRSSPWLCY